MASLLTLLAAQPVHVLKPGEIVITQGQSGGDLYVLESGRLTVERDGVAIATITQPGTAVGEMSVLLGTDHSATVRAETESRVKMLRDAAGALDTDPALAKTLASLLATRLDATSALLVDLRAQHKNAPGILTKLISALQLSSDDPHYPSIDRHDLFEGPV